jgi:hypothetical protein
MEYPPAELTESVQDMRYNSKSTISQWQAIFTRILDAGVWGKQPIRSSGLDRTASLRAPASCKMSFPLLSLKLPTDLEPKWTDWSRFACLLGFVKPCSALCAPACALPRFPSESLPWAVELLPYGGGQDSPYKECGTLTLFDLAQL